MSAYTLLSGAFSSVLYCISWPINHPQDRDYNIMSEHYGDYLASETIVCDNLQICLKQYINIICSVYLYQSKFINVKLPLNTEVVAVHISSTTSSPYV